MKNFPSNLQLSKYFFLIEQIRTEQTFSSYMFSKVINLIKFITDSFSASHITFEINVENYFPLILTFLKLCATIWRVLSNFWYMTQRFYNSLLVERLKFPLILFIFFKKFFLSFVSNLSSVRDETKFWQSTFFRDRWIGLIGFYLVCLFLTETKICKQSFPTLV